MVFYSTTGHCYLFAGDVFLTWDDAWRYCQTLHPAAYLMDIESQEEQDVADNLTSKSKQG